MRAVAIALALALVTAAAAAATMPPPYGPPLTPEGMGPAQIGMTVRQAERALGAKLNVQYPNDKSCGQGQFSGAWYMFENGRLARIDIEPPPAGTLQPPHATAMHIHLGSSEADVKKAYADVAVEPHPYDEHGHYLRVTTKGKKAGFIFETDGTRVTSFRAGIEPALSYQEGCV